MKGKVHLFACASCDSAACVILGYIDSLQQSLVQYRALTSKWVNQPLSEL